MEPVASPWRERARLVVPLLGGESDAEAVAVTGFVVFDVDALRDLGAFDRAFLLPILNRFVCWEELDNKEQVET